MNYRSPLKSLPSPLMGEGEGGGEKELVGAALCGRPGFARPVRRAGPTFLCYIKLVVAPACR